ncbi:LysR family transcriptional regulator [Ralstonia nicotianae]|uniref:LysR family transcriptional regulator n=1 Tax=Ralstonia pseudosolanacearum TaxID=1310165 RepID=UPI0020059F4A|nr:LysR substrate-binding domain-containing protein [Ralstonia pseudosolanacearum]MCK4118453.1 LysR family transcriptional regulator [Ralstonia pseudosolanacearum]
MHDITQAKLRVFQAILDHQSLRKAAEELEISKSLASKHLSDLEGMIGSRLFERTVSGLMPTDAVPLLLDYARSVEAAQEHLLDEMQRIRSLQNGNLLISASEGLIDTLMEDVLASFMKEYPGIQVLLRMRATAEIMEDVAANDAHFGLVYNPPPADGIQFCANVGHHIVAAVHPNHPLAQIGDQVTLAEAMAYPIGIMPESYGLGSLIRMIARAENLSLWPGYVTNTLMALRAYAMKTDGVAFVTNFSIRKEVAAGQLVGIRLMHPLAENQHARVIVKEGRPLPRAAQEVVGRISSVLAALPSDNASNAHFTLGAIDHRRRRLQ